MPEGVSISVTTGIDDMGQAPKIGEKVYAAARAVIELGMQGLNPPHPPDCGLRSIAHGLSHVCGARDASYHAPAPLSGCPARSRRTASAFSASDSGRRMTAAMDSAKELPSDAAHFAAPASGTWGFCWGFGGVFKSTNSHP